jgi:PPM family protein phosphatase
VSAGTQPRCSGCGVALLPEDRYCEGCGAPQHAAAPSSASAGCLACGAPPAAFDADGYCAECGVRRRPGGEHAELDLGRAAAVSDQGLVHRRNEDAFALHVDETGVAVVVCDGISSASAGNRAAQRAAEVAGGVLRDALADPAREPRAAMLDAIGAAQEAVSEVPWTARTGRAVPSCTLVAAICRGDALVVGWLGDSRAYWVGPGEMRQLTVDDSWAREQVADGVLTPEQAARDRRAHAITRWVGADAPDHPPHVEVIPAPRPGRLLLCTDGLWNYAPTPEELAALIAPLPAAASAAALARSLVDVALTRGARDNVTVAVVDIDQNRGARP